MKPLKCLLVIILSCVCLPIFAICSVITSNLTYVSGSGANTVYAINVQYFTNEIQNNKNTSVSFSMSGGVINSGAGPFSCTCTAQSGGFIVNSTLNFTANPNNTISISGTAVGPGNSGSCSSGQGSIALPVELVSFKASVKNKMVQIEWQTASEIDNEGFEIQKSTDGVLFKKFGFVTGAGNVSKTVLYSFLDRKPSLGQNYYRLKQLDYNGKFQFSDIISVDLKLDRGVKIRYDHTEQRLLIHSLNLLQKIELFDILGTRMIQMHPSVFVSEYVMDLNSLPTGIYLLHTIDENGLPSIDSFIRTQ